MILGILSFEELPEYISRQICQCGGSSVYSYKRNSYGFADFRCKFCTLDRIHYWYRCAGCDTYFHRNPSTFSHPGWDWRRPSCWTCLEKDPDYICTDYPESVLANTLAKGKRPPKSIKKKFTAEELDSFIAELME